MNKDIYIIVEGGVVQQVFFNNAPEETANDKRIAIVIHVDREALETSDTRTLVADYVADSDDLEEVAIDIPNFLDLKTEVIAALMKQL